MKNRLFTTIVLSILFTALFITCKKGKKTEDATTTDPPTSSNSPNTVGEIDNLLSRKATPAQTFTINNSINNNLVTVNQTTINIQSGSFFDTILGTYPSNVIITVKEAFTIKDFICNNLTTLTTTGDILNSAGMIYFNVNLGSNNAPLFQMKKLQIKYYSPIIANNIYNTQIYNLNATANTWSLNTQSSSTVLFDSTILRNVYSLINIANMGWTNCDALYSCSGLFPGQNFLFKTSGNYTTSNTKVFFVFTSPACGANFGRTSLMCRLSLTSPQEFYFQNNIPNNLNIKAVAISKINNQLYYEIQPTTVIQNSSMTFTNMQQTDSVQIVSILNGL